MVGRNLRNRRRGRGNSKPFMRNLSDAVQGIISRGRIPVDPPPIVLDRTLSARVEMKVVMSKSTTDLLGTSWLDQNTFYVSKNKDKSSIDPIRINWQDINVCLRASLGCNDSGRIYSIAIKKVSFWGPAPTVTNTSIRLRYDDGRTSRTLSDSGSGLNRPRVSCSIPYNQWSSGNSSDEPIVLLFAPLMRVPDINSELGVVQISALYRVDETVPA